MSSLLIGWQCLSSTTQISIGLIAATFVVSRFIYINRKSHYKKIPGPAGWPILGMVKGLPSEQPWIALKKWGEEFDSDILALNAFGSLTVVVNSWDLAQELFVKRASKFADRPRFPMMTQVAGWFWNFAFMPYGPAWKAHRKLFRQEVEFKGSQLHEPHAIKSVRRFLKRVLENPKDYYAHLRHAAASMVLLTAFGLDIKPANDPFVELAELAMHGLARTGNPGTYLVDYIPALQHIVPTWMPGWFGQWKRDGALWYESSQAMRDVPFEYAMSQYKKGDGVHCIASRTMDRLQYVDEEERKNTLHVLRNILGVVYAAGSDTTVSVIHTFLLAMVLYPELQRKGQEEVDRVIGITELPDFESGHIDSTPYLNALVKECLRWQPVTPLAVAHATSEDVIYNDYFIPKGTAIIGNAWVMLREEKYFGPKTDEFRPERFLTTEEVTGPDGSKTTREILDPHVPHPTMAFGFGRRICPGRHIAYTTAWLIVASLLQCFNIKKGTDEKGQVVTPEVKYTSGLLSFPHHFPCEFEIRSEHSRKIITEITE